MFIELYKFSRIVIWTGSGHPRQTERDRIRREEREIGEGLGQRDT
jgi:hypothetical protein